MVGAFWDTLDQAVEFGYDQRVSPWRTVARAGPGASGAGKAVISVGAILGDAEFQEGLALGGQTLPVGGTADVSDEGCLHEGSVWVRYRFGRVRDGEQHRLLDDPLTDSAVSVRARSTVTICWNTAYLGEAVSQRKLAGLTVEPQLLARVSPPGWAHVLLTGEYRWPKRR